MYNMERIENLFYNGNTVKYSYNIKDTSGKWCINEIITNDEYMFGIGEVTGSKIKLKNYLMNIKGVKEIFKKEIWLKKYFVWN